MSRRSTAPTTIISPNPASKVWRGPCGRRSQSTRAPATKCPRPRARSADKGRHASGPRSRRPKRFIMAVYTVHEPPPKRYEAAPDPERFAFVRDGFSFWACLLGPLWMLRHRMWLVLLGYIVIAVALEIGLHVLGMSGAVSATVGVLLALLIGFEAGTLRRFTLGRRKW